MQKHALTYCTPYVVDIASNSLSAAAEGPTRTGSKGHNRDLVIGTDHVEKKPPTILVLVINPAGTCSAGVGEGQDTTFPLWLPRAVISATSAEPQGSGLGPVYLFDERSARAGRAVYFSVRSSSSNTLICSVQTRKLMVNARTSRRDERLCCVQVGTAVISAEVEANRSEWDVDQPVRNFRNLSLFLSLLLIQGEV